MNIKHFFVQNFSNEAFPWRTFLTHCSVWLVVAGSLVGVQFINNAYPRPLRSLMVMVCAIGGYYLNAEVLVEEYFEKRRYLLYLGIVAFCMFSTTLLNFTVEMAVFNGEIMQKLFIEPRRYIAAVVAISMFIILVGILNTTQRTSRRREQEAQALLTKHKEAELLFLRSQINPHFLFNTLNNIYALAVAGSPQTAPMLMRLSQLLRYSIYSTQKPTVPLKEEIIEIQELITLFKLRSEETMNIDFTTGGNINGQRIEPMILFSLVENCLKHSDIAHNPAGFIAVTLVVQDDVLYFSTLNSKDPTNTQKDSVGGVGLQNTRQRLALKYGSRAELITNNTDTRFETSLRIPILP